MGKQTSDMNASTGTLSITTEYIMYYLRRRVTEFLWDYHELVTSEVRIYISITDQ